MIQPEINIINDDRQVVSVQSEDEVLNVIESDRGKQVIFEITRENEAAQRRG